MVTVIVAFALTGVSPSGDGVGPFWNGVIPQLPDVTGLELNDPVAVVPVVETRSGSPHAAQKSK